MAERKLDVVISAKDQYSGILSSAGAKFQSFGNVAMGAVKIAAAAAAAGMAALTAVMYKGIQAANEQEDAERKLAVALGRTSQALLNQAAALQSTTKFGDESIINAQAMIAMFVKDEDQIKAATKATLDLAAAKGMDLTTAADLVSKTLGSSTNALARYGIEVTGAVGSSERLASLTGNLNKVFGGQASAQAETFSGKMAQMKNAFGDVLEEIGALITKNTFFIKALDVAKGLFEQLSAAVRDNRQFLMELVKSGIVTFVQGISFAIKVVGFFHQAWNFLKIGVQSVILFIIKWNETMFNGMFGHISLLMDKLVELGVISTNPFRVVGEALRAFRENTQAALQGELENAVKTEERYNAVTTAIDGAAEALKKINPAATAPAAPVGPAEEEDPKVKQLTLMQAIMGMSDEMTAKMWQNSQIQAASENVLAQAVQGRGRVTAAVNKAMEEQLLALIETHRFSVSAIGKAMAQAVKIELVGVAAKAAVQALYFTALGIAASTPWGAATLGPPSTFFAAAGKMAAIAGVSLAAAAGVHALVGGNAERGEPGSSTGEPIQVQDMSAGAQSAGGATYNVQLTVVNPLSDKNWDEAIEQSLMPALERAAARNVQLSPNVVRS